MMLTTNSSTSDYRSFFQVKIHSNKKRIREIEIEEENLYQQTKKLKTEKQELQRTVETDTELVQHLLVQTSHNVNNNNFQSNSNSSMNDDSAAVSTSVSTSSFLSAFSFFPSQIKRMLGLK